VLLLISSSRGMFFSGLALNWPPRLCVGNIFFFLFLSAQSVPRWFRRHSWVCPKLAHMWQISLFLDGPWSSNQRLRTGKKNAVKYRWFFFPPITQRHLKYQQDISGADILRLPCQFGSLYSGSRSEQPGARGRRPFANVDQSARLNVSHHTSLSR
jgi:hypothetical protein